MYIFKTNLLLLKSLVTSVNGLNSLSRVSNVDFSWENYWNSNDP